MDGLEVSTRISDWTLQKGGVNVNEPVLYSRGVYIYIGPQNDATDLRCQDS